MSAKRILTYVPTTALILSGAFIVPVMLVIHTLKYMAALLMVINENILIDVLVL